MRSKFSELPGDKASYNVQRQHEPSAAEQGRQRQQRSTGYARKTAGDRTQ